MERIFKWCPQEKRKILVSKTVKSLEVHPHRNKPYQDFSIPFSRVMAEKDDNLTNNRNQTNSGGNLSNLSDTKPRQNKMSDKLLLKLGKQTCVCLIRGNRFCKQMIELADGKPSDTLLNIPGTSPIKLSKKKKARISKKHSMVPDRWKQLRIFDTNVGFDDGIVLPNENRHHEMKYSDADTMTDRHKQIFKSMHRLSEKIRDTLPIQGVNMRRKRKI